MQTAGDGPSPPRPLRPSCGWEGQAAVTRAAAPAPRALPSACPFAPDPAGGAPGPRPPSPAPPTGPGPRPRAPPGEPLPSPAPSWPHGFCRHRSPAAAALQTSILGSLNTKTEWQGVSETRLANYCLVSGSGRRGGGGTASRCDPFPSCGARPGKLGAPPHSKATTGPTKPKG